MIQRKFERIGGTDERIDIGKKGGREKGQDAARCSFRTTTNEGKDDWSDSVSVAPIKERKRDREGGKIPCHSVH